MSRSWGVKSAALLLLLIFAAGCGTDTGVNNPVGTDSYTNNSGGVPAPSAALEAAPIPDALANSSNPEVRKAVQYINEFNSFQQYNGYLTPPEGSLTARKPDGVNAPDYVYVWTTGSLTITMNVWDNASVYAYEMIFDGTDGYYTYTNQRFLEVSVNKNGMAASMTVYDHTHVLSPGDILVTWAWSMAPSGVINFSMETLYNALNFTIDPYGPSGIIEAWLKDAGVLKIAYRVEWFSDGTGYWESYDYGVLLASGAW